MVCLYCGSNNIVYTCNKCHSEFCEKHVISNEEYYCKKHNLTFNKEDAIKFKYRCPVIPKSNCPICSGKLMIDRTPQGIYYLKCTHCSWNSLTNTPALYFNTKKILLQEASHVTPRLVHRAELCDAKLKRVKGVQICPNCFINTLMSGESTTFRTIRNLYSLKDEEIVKIIESLKMDNRITGIIDKEHKVFLYISPNIYHEIESNINNKGMIDVISLSTKYNIGQPYIVRVIYEILSTKDYYGTFTTDEAYYYTINFLKTQLIKRIKELGRVSNTELSREFKIQVEKIKDIIILMIKNRELEAFYSLGGKEVITREKLEKEILAYTKNNGLFKLDECARSLHVTPELVRKTLFNLIQAKRLRGTFTQRREFITEDELSERVKNITKVYRTIKLRELARRLGITELRVEEILANLISRGVIFGYIDMARREFHLDDKQPIVMGTSVANYSNAQSQQGGNMDQETNNIQVLREYDFVGGQLHFKVVVKNMSNMAIHDIKVILDVPTSYKRERDIITISVIDPHNSRGVDFYLEPSECGISTIGGSVIYKDAMGNPHTIFIRPKEVQIKCPLVIKTLDTIEDCQIAIQNMPSDARAFLIADLDPQLAYRAAFRAITNFDTRNVTSLEIPDPNNYKAEAWFSSEAKVTGGRIITRIAVDGKSQSLEIRVWCNDAGQLTGFLAKIVELLFLEINIVRKVKAESRQKTLDAISITQN
ncbi:MAG: PCI domain-containing protein, partial [Promethearchaeota archaeon]